MHHLIKSLARRGMAKLAEARRIRWLDRLQEYGMKIGEDVLIPPSTYVDLKYCHLITVGNSCSLGPDVMIIAHDELAAPYLGAVRVGEVVLHESCHIGARSILLPGVSLGPRTMVAACSVVTETLPANSVCVGNPAKPVSSLQRYLESHRTRLGSAVRFSYSDYGAVGALSPEQRSTLVEASSNGDAYITGGRSAELSGTGGSARTPTRHHRPTPPEPLPEQG